MINWDEAVQKVNLMPFPNDVHQFIKSYVGEFHSNGKMTHQLTTYSRNARISGYLATAKYNFCEECKKVRNQSITIFDNERNNIYQKVFIYHGDYAPDKPKVSNDVNEAKDIFGKKEKSSDTIEFAEKLFR